MTDASIVSLAVLKGSGGPVKTISAFKLALSARLFCFCNQADLEDGPLAIDGAAPIMASSFPILSQMRYAHASATKAARQSISQSRIVSTHSFYRYHCLWVNRVCRQEGTPYWFVPHGVLDPWVMESGRIAKSLFWKFGGQRFLDEAATVIFSTSMERDKAASQFKLPGADVIHWPVDPVDDTNRVERRIAIRNKLGISEDAKVLIYFGRVHPMKRPLDTIRALAGSEVRTIHLLIVGNEHGVRMQDCQRLAQELGVEKRVHCIGPVYGEKKYDYLFAADAYISLSHRENFNHTAAESMAAGLPVILSPGNDLRYDIAEVNCCIDIEGKTVKDAAETISQFATLTHEALIDMGNRGRDWVATNLSFEHFSERLHDLAHRHGR